MFRNWTAAWPTGVCGRMAVVCLAASVSACGREAPTSPQPVPNTPVLAINASVYALNRNDYEYDYVLSLSLSDAALVATVDAVEISLTADAGTFLTTRVAGPFTLQGRRIFVGSGGELSVKDDPTVHPAARQIQGLVSFHSPNSSQGAVAFSANVPTICNERLWFTSSASPIGMGESAELTAYWSNSCNIGLGGGFTRSVAWRSLSPEIVAVPPPSGLVLRSKVVVTGVTSGLAQIEIEGGDIRAVQDVLVAGRLTAFTLSDDSKWPGDFYKKPGSTLLLTAIAEWDGARTSNVTSTSSWSTANQSVARITGNYQTAGILAGSEGTTEVRATYRGMSAERRLVVSETPLRVTVIGPANLAVGSRGVAVARGEWMTETAEVPATWTSSNPLVVSASPSGELSAVASGAADVSATYRGVTGSLRVTVN
jgi:hypothetical protein